MQKVAWFNDIATFWQLWRELPFSKLERFFYDKMNNQLPMYDIGKAGTPEKKRIASLGIFQSGVKPMWEDLVNKDNSEIRCSFPTNLSYETYNQIWEEVVSDLVTAKIPHTNDIAGVRICDKSRNDVVIRIEVWLKFFEDKDPRAVAIMEYLKQEINVRHKFAADISFSFRKK